MKDFKIYQNGNKQMIEKLSVPHFTAVIINNYGEIDLEDILVYEDFLDAEQLSKAINDAIKFFDNYNTSLKSTQ